MAGGSGAVALALVVVAVRGSTQKDTYPRGSREAVGATLAELV